MKNIKVENITKIFPNSFCALNDISFTIEKPGIYGLLGINGAGKTTLLRILSGIISSTSGNVFINNKILTEKNFYLKKYIGFFTEYTKLYSKLSGREFLTYSAQMYGMNLKDINFKIEELSEMLDMKKFIDNKCGTYSTGQTQKISLCRTMLHDPDIYLFDEPYAGLDIISSKIIVDFVIELKKRDKIIIFSTHLISAAEKFSDHIISIHNGKIIQDIDISSLNTSLERSFLNSIKENNV